MRRLELGRLAVVNDDVQEHASDERLEQREAHAFQRRQRRVTDQESSERRHRDGDEPEARSPLTARAKQPVDGCAFGQAVQNERGEQS